MEPVCILENFLKINIRRFCKCNGRIFTVIDHFAWKLVCTGFQKISSHTTFASLDFFDTYIQAPKFTDTGISKRIFGKNGYKVYIFPKIGKRNSHISFSASESGFQHIGLEETLTAWSFQAEHDFTKSYIFQNKHLNSCKVICMISMKNVI